MSNSKITMGDVLEYISKCDHNELSMIHLAFNDRKQMLAKLQGYQMKVGSKVKFTPAINPKYLSGLPVTVTKINRESVIVSCPDESSYGRFRNLKKVRVPLTVIVNV